MGKTLRKYRKSRTYDPVASAEKASPYDIHDGKGTKHVDSDLLSSPREFVPLDQLAPGHASPLRVWLTMMVTSIGAMAVALPYAMLQGGFVMSIFMISFVGLVTHVTRTRLVELGVEQGIYSFQGLAKLAFGPIGGFAVGVTQLGVSIGFIIAYLLIVFQDVPIVLGRWLKMDFDQDGRPIVTPGTRASPLLTLLADHYWFPEVLVVLILLPYCLYATSFARMRMSPGFVFVAVLAAAFSAIVKARSEYEANAATGSQGYSRDYLEVPSTVCQAFAIITTTVCSQHHSFHTFHAMRDRCPVKFKRISLMAMLGSLAFGLSIGIGGYVSFLGATKGDVVHNYDFGGNRFALIFWTALPFCAVSCIAYEVIVSRHTMQFLCLPSVHKDDERQDVLFASQNVSKTPTSERVVEYEQAQPSTTSQLFTAMALVVVAQVPIFYAQDVALVLSLTGGLAGITLCFILPAACQLKLSPLNGWCSDYFVPCLSIVIGVVGALAAVISTAVHARHDTTASDPTS